MEASSAPANSLPEGVSEEDLYEGPKVVPISNGKAAPVAEPPPSPQELTKPIPPPSDRGVNWLAIPPGLAPAPSAEVSVMPSGKTRYPEIIMVALDILAARVHALIALVAACLIWAGVVWDPEFWRVIAASAFSVTIFLPVMWVLWKAGMTGEGE